MKQTITFFLVFLGCLPSLVMAQYFSDNNKFSINERKGCAPLSFKINHPSCPSGISCTLKFGDGRPDIIVHDGDVIPPYTTPGTYTMQVIAQSFTDNDQIQITVSGTTAPTFQAVSCAGRQVQVTVTDTQYPLYIIDFGQGGEQMFSQTSGTHSHTYTGALASPRTIKVRGQLKDTPDASNDVLAQDNCPVTSQDVIEAVTLPAATIDQVAVTSATSVDLDYTATSSIQYRLMIAKSSTSGFQVYKTLFNPSVTDEVINVLQPDNFYYCFRLDSYSPPTCAISGVSSSSNVVCSIDFDVTAQNKANALTWVTGNIGPPTFTLTRDGATIPLTHLDTDVVCNTDSTYQLTASFGGKPSISLPKTVTAISTDPPDSIVNISAIVSGQSSVVLDWKQPSGYTAATYTISEITGGSFRVAGQSTQPSFEDDHYSAGSCYSILYKDACGNNSAASRKACPVNLHGKLDKDNTTELTWTAYNGWKQGVDHYEIYQDGNQIDTTPAGTTSLSVPNDFNTQEHTYLVKAVPVEATVPPITLSASNVITIIKTPNLYYPTAFTPNTDGLNDHFKVFSQFTAKFELKIFNRWGELMFITSDLTDKGWDGTYKGNPMPEGTYVFTAKITDFAGRTFDRSGTVVLLRKP